MTTPSFAGHWSLDPAVGYLNHGSFGACPTAVLEVQAAIRARLERQPTQFFRDLLPLLDEARAALGAFVGADPDDLAWLPNATSGVSTVAASLQLEPGDELLTTSHAYNACRNALRAQERRGAKVVVAQVPFPLSSPQQVLDAVLAQVTARTRLALIDHVTSPTGLVFPVAALVRALEARGVDTLVDGAHAPGMLPLDLKSLGAAYYTGNCHKWLCSPKGAAFLHVRRDRQEGLSPLVIGHGFNAPARGRSRFRLLFDWTGTHDPSPYLSVPAAITLLGGLHPGGFPALMERNRTLALQAQRMLCEVLGIDAPAPPEMIGSLASVPLPPLAPADSEAASPATPGAPADPLHRRLLREHGFEVWLNPFGASPARVLRISAAAYTDEGQLERFRAAFKSILRQPG